MKNCRSILLLDFDGVIVDSTALKTNAFVELYHDAEFAEREAIREYQVRHAGISRNRKIAHFETTIFGRTPNAPEIAEKIRRYGELVEDAVTSCAWIPGALELLHASQGKHSLYLISGTPHVELNRIVKRRGIASYFRDIIGSPTLKAEAFRTILNAEGARPDEALAVGDSITEFHATSDAGIPFIGIVAENQSNPFPPAVTVYRDLHGLARYLSGQRKRSGR